ncbi:MAG: FadR/GntR family transcriptional regulator [Veillonellales bacterium]
MKADIDKELLNKVIDKSSTSLYRQIVEHIRNWIREGKLKEGDSLPSERELTKIFDVSRVPVREALKTLEFLGAVEHIRGKGVFVKKIKMSHILNNVDFVMENPKSTLADLFEAREAIESYAVRLAAERRTVHDLEAMESALIDMERNIKMGKSISDASIGFHSAIFIATHNEILIKINDFLTDLLSYSRQYSQKDPARYHNVLEDHKGIWQKIKEQNPGGAAAIMAGHLQRAKQVIDSL